MAAVLALNAFGVAARAAGPPVLFYDGWTGELSIRTNGQAVDDVIISSESAMLLPRFVVFPEGSANDAITPSRLTMSAGTSPLGDADFGPILPAGLEARLVESDLGALVRFPDQSNWEGIVVDLGNGTAGGGPIGAAPEPSAVPFFVVLALLSWRRRQAVPA